MRVGRHLYLHMSSVGHEALGVEPLIAERGARLGHGHPEHRPQLLRCAHHALEPERPACAHDAHGDLAAVGDEHPREGHQAGSTRNSGCPSSTSAALSAQISTIVPSTPAGIEFIIFMTSIRHTVVSGETFVPTSTNGAAPGASAL